MEVSAQGPALASCSHPKALGSSPTDTLLGPEHPKPPSSPFIGCRDPSCCSPPPLQRQIAKYPQIPQALGASRRLSRPVKRLATEINNMAQAYLARYPSLHSHLRLPPALLVSAPRYYHGRP